MQRWGRTAAGAVRFYCRTCRITRTRQRVDQTIHIRRRLFIRWLVSKQSIDDFAGQIRHSARTVRRWFTTLPLAPPCPLPPPHSITTLVVDGTTVIAHQLVVLIAYATDTQTPVDWMFAPRESFWSWYEFFVSLKARGVTPLFVVSDGQKGLLAAIHAVWPSTIRQRCMAHIIRQGLAWLTRSPKTIAGQELRRLVCGLSSVRMHDLRCDWERQFAEWRQQFNIFLKERTQHPIDPRRWWYTHRKLRAVRSLISNALPELFTYINHPSVPRTTNHVEGGINAQLKELFRSHRGISQERKAALVGHYLVFRQRRRCVKRKPTRNGH